MRIPLAHEGTSGAEMCVFPQSESHCGYSLTGHRCEENVKIRERKKKRVLTRYTKMIPLHSIKAQFWSNVELICSIFLNIDFSSDVKKAVTCERQQADRATEGPMSWFSRALGLFRTQSKESRPMNFISEMKNEKKKQNRHHRVCRHRARLRVGRLIKEVR